MSLCKECKVRVLKIKNEGSGKCDLCKAKDKKNNDQYKRASEESNDWR